MNVDNSRFNFPEKFHADLQNLAKAQVELGRLFQDLNPNKNLNSIQSESLTNAIERVNEIIVNLNRDLDVVKNTQETSSLSKNITQILHTNDLLDTIDVTKERISRAKNLIIEIHQLFTIDAFLPEKKFVIQEDTKKDFFEAIDAFWDKSSKKPTPTAEKFVSLAERALEKYAENIEELSLLAEAHQCFEKAAESYSLAGNRDKAFAVRARIAAELAPPFNHPLYNLTEKLQEKKTLTPPEEPAIRMNHLDSGGVKRGLVEIKQRNFEGNEKIVTLFFLNKFVKEKVVHIINQISHEPDQFSKYLPPNLEGKITIREVNNGYFGKNEGGEYSRDMNQGLTLGKALEVEFGDWGLIRIAKDDTYRSLTNRIVIELNPEKNSGEAMQQMHTITSLLGFGPVFGIESKEEEMRKKIALLFHNFHPQEAYQLENNPSYYEVSPEKMQEIILQACPEMGTIFEKYLTTDRLEQVEMGADVTMWAIPDMADLMRNSGGIGLMAGFSGDAEVLAKILTTEMLCSQERFEIGNISAGVSPSQDHIHGGAGGVFTRLITNKMVSTIRRQYVEASDSYEDVPASMVGRYPHASSIQLLIDLEAVNLGGYASEKDRYGSKSAEYYGNRSNFIDFAKDVGENSITNELILRDRVASKYIRKVLVQSPFRKKKIIEEMIEKELTEEREGVQYLKGRYDQPLEKLIIVDRYFRKEMWETQ